MYAKHTYTVAKKEVIKHWQSPFLISLETCIVKDHTL